MDCRHRLLQANQLFTLPEIAIKLLDAVQQADPDLDELGRLVSLDPALSGRILRAVNSPLFGLKTRVSHVGEALPKIGLSLTRTLVVSFHLADYKDRAIAPELLRLHWRRSLIQAVLAELIGESVAPSDAPNYFLAGLIQDVGLLAMVAELGSDYAHSDLYRESLAATSIRRELRAYAISHAELSAEMAQRWGLGQETAAAIRHHHHSLADQADRPARELELALKAAAIGAHLLDSAPSSADVNSDFSEFLALGFNLPAEAADDMLRECLLRVNEYAALFSFDVACLEDCETVLRQANELLQDLALSAQIDLLRQEAPSGGNSVSPKQNPIFIDEQTGFYNRRYLTHYLRADLEACRMAQQPISLLFIDIDKFKSINDNYGHTIGDLAIRQIAKHITKFVRGSDVAIRFGGDEFILFLPGVSRRRLEKIAGRMARRPVEVKTTSGQRVAIKLSVGGTCCPPGHSFYPDPNQLIDVADRAMYRAKRCGGGIAMIADPIPKELDPIESPPPVAAAVSADHQTTNSRRIRSRAGETRATSNP